MQPKEVAASYDEMAGRWDDKKFNRANGILQHKRALQFGPRGKSALDVGCGSSGRFIDLLTSAGFDVEGLDLSAEMIRRARIRHPGVVFHHADICSLEPSRKCDFITAGDSVWHFPLDRQEGVLKKAVRRVEQRRRVDLDDGWGGWPGGKA